MELDKILDEINENKGITALIESGAEVFVVGGAVRDALLGVKSKDIDLVVRLKTINTIQHILNPFGKIDIVGASFGVLKFTPNGHEGEPFDIALPRTEKKVGEGHHGFEINSDPFLPLEADLLRRDLTINAIAVNVSTREIVDPFFGRTALNNGFINCVSDDTFFEDPLRMIRAFQFSSRFGFTILGELLDGIEVNGQSIQEISGERVFIELEKMFKKRKSDETFVNAANELLRFVWNHMNAGHIITKFNEGDCNTFVDFLFLLFNGNGDLMAEKLATSTELVAQVNILNKMCEHLTSDEMLMTALAAETKFSELKSSMIFTQLLDKRGLINKFVHAEVRNLKGLAVNGNDLMELGFKGQQIGQMLNKMLLLTATGRVKNKKETLLKCEL